MPTTHEKAIRENTKALRANTEALRTLVQETDKEKRREKRRGELRAGGPYTREQLYGLKRPDLVMYAAQLGIKNTSIPQGPLVEAVVSAQGG